MTEAGARRLGLLGGALVLALVAGVLRGHPVPDEVVYPDAAVYMRQAQGYLDGKASIAPPWRHTPAGGPVYPALTALVTPLAGDVDRAGLWVSRAAGVALVLLVAGLALALGGPAAGAGAGLFTAVAPRLIHFSEVRLTEALFLALTLAALAWGIRAAAGRTRPWEDLALGALLGTVALTRAVGSVLLPVATGAVLVAGAVLLREPPKVWGMRTLRVAAVALLVLGAYQAYAWSHGWYTAFDTHVPPALRGAAPIAAGTDAPAPGPPPQAAQVVRDVVKGGGVTLETQGRVFRGMLPVLVWLLAAGGLALRLARGRGGDRAPEVVLLGWGAAYLTVLAVFETSLDRYLLAATPVVLVYAGCGVGGLWEGSRAVLRRVAPGAVAAAAAGALVAAVGGAAAYRMHARFALTERVYPPARALAADIRRTVVLEEPVRVFAAHAFLPYYLHGFWIGLPVAPGETPGGAGSRVVVLETARGARWDPAWRQAVAAGADVGPFRLVAERYFPDQVNLLTVYADAPAAPDAASGEALLARGHLAQARTAFARAGTADAALRADAVRAMALGPYLREDLSVAAQRYAAAAETAAPDGADGPRVPWPLPPGVFHLGVGPVATAWNRAALALALNRPGAAARHAAEAGHLAPALASDPRMAYLSGMILGAAGRSGRSLRMLEAARAGLPDDPGVAVAWANALASAGRFAEAATGYEGVLDRDPGNGGVWLNLAHARADAGDLDGARAALKRARGLPLRPSEREYLGVLDRALTGVPGARSPDG